MATLADLSVPSPDVACGYRVCRIQLQPRDHYPNEVTAILQVQTGLDEGQKPTHNKAPLF